MTAIPRLHELSATQQHYVQFFQAVQKAGFKGDVSPEYSQRTVLATDNSIYQMLPQGVLYPANEQDLQIIAGILAQPEFHDVKIGPRGGGTGTNGQSLTDGVVVDVSKRMNQILEINPDERWVRVQSGVVKDQLNAALKPYGLFFAPELSTSNRATIGGMISTDASGQGSVLYGKTRDHVLATRTIIHGGEVLQTAPVSDEIIDGMNNQESRIGEIHRIARAAFDQNKADIAEKFPPLNRCLTGYDLAHIRNDAGQVDLNNLICGSEGTLGLISEAKLNVLPIPKVASLICVCYESFEDSMRDAQALMAHQPSSIETVDSFVLQLAKDDLIWHTVADFFPASQGKDIAGVNFVEYTADDEATLAANMQSVLNHLDAVKGQAKQAFAYGIAKGDANVKKVWAMRKKAVGLLGNAKGEARPIPFVEDTAVPPENLADFIMDFRAALDKHNLRYGMFGHVDAGVLHVRPAIDMKDAEQAKLIRGVTDEVVELVKKYNGLLWGEHGKGVRSEYAPKFFGSLYPILQEIKASFDPYNQFNPGKIATPKADIPLYKIDEVTTRGELDATIKPESWQQFDSGMYCNGNGACYNWDPADAMCPSYKVTRDRRHSPKGRSSLIREWLRLLSERNIDSQKLSDDIRARSPIANALRYPAKLIRTAGNDYDYSNEVYESMGACLACKSCTGACPIKVDVPEFRARFLELYHDRYARPLKDYLIGSLEFLMPVFRPVPWLYNLPMQLPPVKWALAKFAGMVDSPLLDKINFAKEAKKRGFEFATPAKLAKLTPEQRQLSPVLVQDAFTSYFDAQVVLDILESLRIMGFEPKIMPFSANGKPLHVHGFLTTFKKVALRTSKQLEQFSQLDMPLLGVDPSMTLSYRAEYKKYVSDDSPEVMLVQEYLAKHADHIRQRDINLGGETYHLMGHCTEKTNAANSQKDWSAVFSAVGLTLQHESVGCCGMAGTYGHETRNKEASIELWNMSWKEPVQSQKNLVAPGYSCRSQAKRVEGIRIPHPLQVIVKRSKEVKSQ